MSASDVGNVTQLSRGVSTQSTNGDTQVVSLDGSVSTMGSSGATTCYKKKTCSEGGYLSSIPDKQTCDPVKYNGYTCYENCREACPSGYYATSPSLNSTQSTYMEVKQDSSSGCYYVRCKSAYSINECVKGIMTNTTKCGSLLASYDNSTYCYDPVGIFELTVTDLDRGDPYWSYDYSQNGGSLSWSVTASFSGTCHIKGSYHQYVGGCPRGDFDYSAQPFTSGTDSWSTGSQGGGGFVSMPENWEILQTMPKCLNDAQLLSVSTATINASSNTSKVQVVTY